VFKKYLNTEIAEYAKKRGRKELELDVPALS
jgi:hypothetical protein